MSAPQQTPSEANLIFQALAEQVARNHSFNMDGRFFVIAGLDDAKNALTQIFEGRSIMTDDLEAMRGIREEVISAAQKDECPVIKRLRRSLHEATFG